MDLDLTVRYAGTRRGIFLSRQSRFTARVQLEGREISAHIKTTGRCAELLLPGAAVVVCPAMNPARATAWDLVAVYKGEMLVNIDSQAPNQAALPWLRARYPGADIRGEVTLGESRLDFLVRDAKGSCYVEVKGVTLEQEGLALFPDAPTARGLKHLCALSHCVSLGHRALALFVVQMRPVRAFAPHAALDPAFAQGLREAARAGVEVVAVDCLVQEDGLTIGQPLPLLLD